MNETQREWLALLIAIGLTISSLYFLLLLPVLLLGLLYAVTTIFYFSGINDHSRLLEALVFIGFIVLLVYSLLTGWILMIIYAKTGFNPLPGPFWQISAAISVLLGSLMVIYVSLGFADIDFLLLGTHGLSALLLSGLLWRSRHHSQQRSS